MRISPIACALWVAVASAALWAGAADQPPQSSSKAAATSPTAVYFNQDVMPLLTKFGCNQGQCHGSPAGQAGLRLSMFGADADADYDAFARHASGRRIDLVSPKDSLLLLKPTATIKHGGGQRFAANSADYDVLLRWLSAGAPKSDPQPKSLVRLEIGPAPRPMTKGETLPLSATAVFEGDVRRDVTAMTRFRSNDATVAAVDTGGKLEARGFGQTSVVATYLRVPAVMTVVVPQPLPGGFPDIKPNNKIDELVFAKLRELGLPPSDVCTDSEFLRRVGLDAIGTLPKPEEAKAFLADADPRKRAKWIDKLLASEEFADFWALKWGDLFRVKSEFPSNLWPNAVQAYHQWTRTAIARNMPYDQFVRELLTSTGSNFRDPPVNFYRAFLKRDPQNLAEVTALVFMGARLGCARCHAHPDESWKLDDSLGMAAFFAQVRYKNTTEWKEEIVYLNPQQTLRHPVSGAAVRPKFLDGPSPTLEPNQDARVALAKWLTAPDNPYFAKNIVNRTWFWLLGRGIVHEVDDLRPTNPPSNPELLKYLESELAANRYDLKHIYRLILNSKTYQLSSRPNAANKSDTAHFSHYYLKRLGAETLLDAIGQLTERWDTYKSIIPEPFVELPAGFRATHLADGSIGLPFLELFGRPPRDTAFESDRDLDLSARQTLHLLNSNDVHNKIANSPRLQRMAQQKASDAQVVEELYLAAFSRLPSEQESQDLEKLLAKDPKQRPQAVQDLLWALMNTKEFLFNH